MDRPEGNRMKVMSRILWIEGKRAESPHIIPQVRKKGYIVETVATGNEAYGRLSGFNPDLVVINASSMRTSGKRICNSLRKKANNIPILLISDTNPTVSVDVCANLVLSLPFTSRKLLNRMKLLLPDKGDNVYSIGSISLNVERKLVRCQDRESTLTPRLVQLLKIFIDNPGEVLERKKLFREIWNTEYTGDTRTLDVHISWLRQAIEDDPRQPQYIKTIRGVGYRLDV